MVGANLLDEQRRIKMLARKTARRKAALAAMTPGDRVRYRAENAARGKAKRAARTPEERARHLSIRNAKAKAKRESQVLTPEQRTSKQRKQRSRQLKCTHGITLDEWEALFNNQGRVCACCGSDHPKRKSKGWSTDHDHTKKIGDLGFLRGILCFSCNTGIGKLGDDLEGVQQAVSYLKKAQKAQQ